MITPAYSNLKEFIENGKEIKLTYNNFSFLEIFKDIKFPVYNILQDYIEELIAESSWVKLTEDEYIKYKYKPRLLSANLYGTTEYFYVLLMINGMASEKEFDKKVFRIISEYKFKDTLQRIYIAEKNNIDRYNATKIDGYETGK